MDEKMMTHIGPKAREIIDRDQAVMSPSYTRSHPLVIARGQGAEVWDADGRRYLDFTTGIAVTATGHTHPDVVQAIKDQADKFLHMSGTDFFYEVQVQLAEKLVSIAPFKEPSRVFFANSGTEAIEAALKLARYHTGRPRMIGFLSSFHGRTMGSLGMTSSKHTQRKGFFAGGDGVVHIPYADAFRPLLAVNGFNDYGEGVVDYIENVIFRTIAPADEVAGILVEPIQGEGGYVVPTAGFFPALRSLCDRYGILLIIDEVQTGIGRTGKWWGIQNFGIEPDILASAKGIASGMPLGVMMAKKRIMTWEPGAHASTFGGNPVCCAAALATLKLLEDGMLDNAVKMGEYLMTRLLAIQARHPIIGDVRGRGLMIGVDFVTDTQTRKHNRAAREAVIDACFERDLLVLGAGQSAIRVIPPLNITPALCDEMLEKFEQAVSEIEPMHFAHAELNPT